MKIGELTSDNYSGKGLVVECQKWQRLIDIAETPIEKDTIGRLACSELSGIARSKGSPKVLVRSFRAVVLPEDGPAEDEEIEVIEFERIIATGWLGRINYLVMNQERNLTWPLYNVHVLNTSENVVTAAEMTEEPRPYLPAESAGPIHLPISYIDFAVYAA